MSSVKKISICAICTALCTVLPPVFHMVGLGSVFSPMHIPVLLCGLVCGWPYGALCGLVGPAISSLSTGMPGPAYLIHMAPELCVYGLVCGLLMAVVHTGRPYADLYCALIPAMLLGRVAGLTAATAKNVVKYRDENGMFTSRKQILKVPKLGPKAFEQCAGFLRVPESGTALDNTAVHPESYRAAERLLELTGHTLAEVSAGKLGDLDGQIRAAGAENLAEQCGVGVPTLLDVAKELQKPGRDPRDELPPPLLRTDVLEIKDLQPGMVLTGTVRNVIDFGVFVDIGVHQDGLVHISQISDKFLKHPSEALAVGDIVKVVVLEVDEKKKRISLSIKQAAS